MAADDAFEMAMLATKDADITWTESPSLGLIHIRPQDVYDLLPPDVRKRVSPADFKTIWKTELAIWINRQMRIEQGKREKEILRQIAEIDRVDG